MLVMILSVGIVNILSWLAGIINLRSDKKIGWMVIIWLILLLLAHLKMFWHTLDILSIEALKFSGFLYIITGPILILFATNIMLPEASHDEPPDPKSHYIRVCRWFFFIFSLLQLWNSGVDIFLGKGFTGAGGFNAALFVVSGVLASSQNTKLHVAGTGVACLLFFITLLLRGLGAVL
jgi:hypothetical protein